MPNNPPATLEQLAALLREKASHFWRQRFVGCVIDAGDVHAAFNECADLLQSFLTHDPTERHDAGEGVRSIWDEVDEFLEDHHQDFNLSFGLEYSSVIDWVCEFVPRRNHKQAREYNGPWSVQSGSRDDAIRKAIAHTSETLGIAALGTTGAGGGSDL